MNIQYSKRKQDIKTDPLLEFLARVKQFATANSNALFIAALAAIIGVGSVLTYGTMRRNSIRKAQESFGSAMMAYSDGDGQKALAALSTVEQNHAGTPQAAFSAYLMGHLLLKEGKYDEAIAQFETAKSKAKGTLVAGGAIEGLAVCYEAKGDRDRAMDLFNQALADETVRYRRPAIRWKLALLNKEMEHFDKAQRYCREIVSDSLGTEYRDRAENLLAEIGALRGS